MAELHGKLILGRLSRYMDYADTKRWVDKLDDVVTALNKRKLKRLNSKVPDEISCSNQHEAVPNKNALMYEHNPKFELSVGDGVNVLKTATTFSKARHGIWDVGVYLTSIDAVFQMIISDDKMIISDDNIRWWCQMIISDDNTRW